MIAGYILTGGRNTRMNGNKKLFLTYRNKTFLTHIFQALTIFPTVYLSVENKYSYKKLQMPLVQDIYPDIGPIGGIYSGLCQCPEDALFVVACDMPLIDQETIKTIRDEYEKHPDKITIAKTKERIHPLCGIYPKSIAPIMKQMIEAKDYKVRDLFVSCDVSIVELNNERAVKNVNTPGEYEQLITEIEADKWDRN